MRILLLVVALLAGCALADIWSSCSASNAHLTNLKVNFSPNPPVVGQTFNVAVTGNIDETVTGGKVDVTVNFSGTPIVQQTLDLCTIFPEIKCPINQGALSLSVSQQIPAFAPAGEYDGNIVINDQNGQQVTCINFKFTMGSSQLAVSAAKEPMALDDSVIERVNKAGLWVAGRNKRFEGMTLKEAKKLLGTIIVPRSPLIKTTAFRLESIPDSFDARQQWPNCIHPIRNQQQCGSCWAFSATEALSDRFCIASKGAVNVILSPEDMVSCDDTDQGCNGGELQTAWNYLVQDGVVTDACLPYTAGDGNAPACPTDNTCQDGSAWKKYKAAKGTITNPTTIEAIQSAIMTSGPVQAAFSVYNDFFNYKGGVYRHVSGDLAGGHAIKLVGWGSDNGTPYWIVANSWGEEWGLKGYFWILRGSDECGIEDNVFYGLPRLN